MTNVPQPTFGPRGFVIPTAQAVLAGVIADFQQAFGGGLNLSATDTATLSTPQGQLATSIAAIIYNAYETFQLYTNQVDPAYASGRMQDAIGRIYNMVRNPALPTSVQALCSGLPGVVIPVDALAVATDGNLYRCTAEGTIPSGGSITLAFACTEVGPIACPAGTLNKIYQAISGWDSITNPTDGTPGIDTENRAEFEARRSVSVAVNSLGTLAAIRAAVLAVADVLDTYVTENDTDSPVTVLGATLAAKSVYVAAVGGLDEDVARAIWSKKAPGCAYNGNTTVTIYDTDGYASPYPSYDVKFERPITLAILFAVTIAASAQVPSDATTQIQAAIVSAFSGGDGGQRAKIGGKIYASRFYAPIAAIGAWAQIVSILVGSNNSPAASLTGSISGTTLTVSAVASGSIAAGQTVSGTGVAVGTVIQSQLSGTPGGAGTYELNFSMTVGSEALLTTVAGLNDLQVNINQAPTVSALNVQVTIS